MGAGWSSLVARRVHDPEVAGSNPALATTNPAERTIKVGWLLRLFMVVLAVRCFGYVATYWSQSPRLTKSPTFEAVVWVMPLRAWMVLVLLVGIGAVGGAIAPVESPARVLLLASMMLHLALAVLVLLAGTWSPAIVSFGFAATVDFIMAVVPYVPAGVIAQAGIERRA